MQEALKSLEFNIGYLRRSDKARILEVLRAEQAKRLEMRKQQGSSSASALQEVAFLSKSLMDLYKGEKGPEGADRLYSAGHEVGQILRDAELFDVFEISVLNAFKRHYRSKIDEGRDHEFYLNKARSLLGGLGEETLSKFEAVLSDLKLTSEPAAQVEFGSKLPTEVRN